MYIRPKIFAIFRYNHLDADSIIVSLTTALRKRLKPINYIKNIS